MFDVLAMGELLIDFAPLSVDSCGYPSLQAQPGGAPANFLAALSEYGCRTGFIGKAGRDHFGRLLKATLESRGINTENLILDPDYFTTLAFVALNEQGERTFSFARKPGADTQLHFEEINLHYFNLARVFHFGTLSLTDEPSRTTTQNLVSYARKMRLLLSFDPNYRPPLWHSEAAARKEILWGISQTDLIKISEEEIDFLWGISAQAGAEKLLNDYDIKLAMVTLGEKGSILKSRAASCRIGVPAVKPVDTTGAGDIFGGSALSQILALQKDPAFLTEEELLHIGRFAGAAASLSTQSHGGISSVPALSAVQEVCSQGSW